MSENDAVAEMRKPIVRAVDPEHEWFKWSGRHPVAALLLVGLVATQVATTIGYYLPAVGLPSLPWPLFNGVLAAPKSTFGAADSFFVGELTHMINGIVFTVLFGVLIYRRLPFGTSSLANMLKALTFGVVLTVISTGVLVPLVYAPDAGYGFFSFFGPVGWKEPFAILIWHLVYAVHIGALYNPVRAQEAQVWN